MGSFMQYRISTQELMVLSPQNEGWKKFLIIIPLIDDLPKEGLCFTTYSKAIGGIGVHPRMEVQFPTGDLEAQGSLFVSFIRGDEERLEKLLSDIDIMIEITGNRSYFAIHGNDNIGTIVIVNKRANVPMLISTFAWENFTARVLKKDEFKIVEYMPDKLSRAQQMWSMQYKKDPAAVGPVRDGWRFNSHSYREGWSSVHSFQGYGREISKELLGEHVSELPDIVPLMQKLNRITNPIRHYVIEQILRTVHDRIQRINEANAVHDIAATSPLGIARQQHPRPDCTVTEETTAGCAYNEKGFATDKMTIMLEKLKATSVRLSKEESPTKVPSLTMEQMHQINKCVYSIDYAPYTEEHKARLRHATLLYAIHGTVGRISGSYKRSGKYRGLSDGVRVFRGESSEQLQSAFENGDTSVLTANAINRLQTKNGKLQGTGGRGYKGIHGDTRTDIKKVYMPMWYKLRTKQVQSQMSGKRSVSQVKVLNE